MNELGVVTIAGLVTMYIFSFLGFPSLIIASFVFPWLEASAKGTFGSFDLDFTLTKVSYSVSSIEDSRVTYPIRDYCKISSPDNNFMCDLIEVSESLFAFAILGLILLIGGAILTIVRTCIDSRKMRNTVIRIIHCALLICGIICVVVPFVMYNKAVKGYKDIKLQHADGWDLYHFGSVMGSVLFVGSVIMIITKEHKGW